MSRYPKLDVCPLPFPYSDPSVTEKRNQLVDIAADLENKFRNSPAFIHPVIILTPDVERFVEKSILAFGSDMDYSRLPLELHPNYFDIKRKRLKDRKRKKPK